MKRLNFSTEPYMISQEYKNLETTDVLYPKDYKLFGDFMYDKYCVNIYAYDERIAKIIGGETVNMCSNAYNKGIDYERIIRNDISSNLSYLIQQLMFDICTQPTWIEIPNIGTALVIHQIDKENKTIDKVILDVNENYSTDSIDKPVLFEYDRVKEITNELVTRFYQLCRDFGLTPIELQIHREDTRKYFIVPSNVYDILCKYLNIIYDLKEINAIEKKCTDINFLGEQLLTWYFTE